MDESPQRELSKQSRKAASEYKLRWLLAFPDMTLRDDGSLEYVQLTGDVMLFAMSHLQDFGKTAQLVGLPGDAMPTTTKMLRKLQRDVRDALDRLASGETWDAPQIASKFRVRNGGAAHFPPAEGSVLQKEYKGGQRQVFLAAVGDVLKDGWHLVRWCKNPDCQKPFVPIRRQEYHDPKCSQKVRTDKYRNKDDK